MKTFKFYGVCHNKFKLDDKVWEAVEDADDGYRSHLETIRASAEDATFSRYCIAEVRINRVVENNFDGYQLIDIHTGHIWLEIGTCNDDEYYPMFVFSYYIPLNFDEWAGLN